jgi:hypothetical protein
MDSSSAIARDTLRTSFDLRASSAETVPTPAPISTIVATTFQKSSRRASSDCVQTATFLIVCSCFHSSSLSPSSSSLVRGRGGRKYTHASGRQSAHASPRTDDFLWRTESARSPLTPFVSFRFVTSAGPSSTMRAASVHSAQAGPCAAHDGSCAARVVRSVLISIESDLPELGVEGVGVDDRAGATVSAAATVSESRVCVWERGICEAPRAKPPRAWHA